MTAHDTKTRWYRVPVVWLAIVLSVVTILGIVHLFYVGHANVDSAQKPKKINNKDMSHVLGMPLSRDVVNTQQTPNKTSQQDSSSAP